MSWWSGGQSAGVGNDGNTFLYLDAVTRVVVHARGARHAVVLVTHVIGDDAIARACRDRAALTNRAGRGVGFLAALLDLVPGVATAHGTGDRRQRPTLATANLVTQQAASHRTDGRAGDLMLIPDRHMAGHDLVV